jgi:hypothetical protein
MLYIAKHFTKEEQQSIRFGEPVSNWKAVQKTPITEILITLPAKLAP